MSRELLSRLEVKKAVRNCDIHNKIAAFTALGNTDMLFLNENLRSVSKYPYSQGCKEVYCLTYESTINGNSMEGIQFVKNAEFFYGLPVESIEIFSKDSYQNETIDSFGVEFMEFQTNWIPSYREDAILQQGEEPNHYDMALINGRFWTFAPNLSTIKEIAFQA